MMKRLSRVLAAATLMAAALACHAESSAEFMKRTQTRFGEVAGSPSNLNSLVAGLRTGQPVTLRGDGEVVRFTPATRPMGYGNVTRTLDLATRELAAEGISNPTPKQLGAALNGGTVTGANGPVSLPGVLQLRSSGMGWGKIAHTIGVHPGMGAPAQARFATPSAVPPSGAITTASGRTVITNAHANGRGQVQPITTHSSAAGGNAGGNGGGKGNAFGRGK